MRYEVMNGQPADVAVRRVTAPQTSYAFLHAAYTRPSHQLERHPASVVTYGQNESFSNFVSSTHTCRARASRTAFVRFS